MVPFCQGAGSAAGAAGLVEQVWLRDPSGWEACRSGPQGESAPHLLALLVLRKSICVSKVLFMLLCHSPPLISDLGPLGSVLNEMSGVKLCSFGGVLWLRTEDGALKMPR